MTKLVTDDHNQLLVLGENIGNVINAYASIDVVLKMVMNHMKPNVAHVVERFEDKLLDLATSSEVDFANWTTKAEPVLLHSDQQNSDMLITCLKKRKNASQGEKISYLNIAVIHLEKTD